MRAPTLLALACAALALGPAAHAESLPEVGDEVLVTVLVQRAADILGEANRPALAARAQGVVEDVHELIRGVDADGNGNIDEHPKGDEKYPQFRDLDGDGQEEFVFPVDLDEDGVPEYYAAKGGGEVAMEELSLVFEDLRELHGDAKSAKAPKAAVGALGLARSRFKILLGYITNQELWDWRKTN
ncbi:MAG TPA: hypothetical protein VEI97_03485 [bacterium]|nr:hypothetical protein [bacterium]